MPDDPIIASTTPRTGDAPDTQSDLAALTVLKDWAEVASAFTVEGWQIVADAYDHLARRLGIEEKPV